MAFSVLFADGDAGNVVGGGHGRRNGGKAAPSLGGAVAAVLFAVLYAWC